LVESLSGANYYVQLTAQVGKKEWGN